MANIDYWNQVYTRQGEVELNTLKPSQFAAFCLNEVDNNQKIIDCGCGNGRDSFFFARYGLKVLGIDGSSRAIAINRGVAERNNLDQIQFEQLDFSQPETVLAFAKTLKASDESLSIYSRFFLHAITEEEQTCFFEFCQALNAPGMRVLLEFRTAADATEKKITGEHFRRFLTPADVSSDLKQAGFETLFWREGQGYAKHREEDAHVCRLIAEAVDV